MTDLIRYCHVPHSEQLQVRLKSALQGENPSPRRKGAQDQVSS
ncbi:MAG: hypothetical protein QNJ55_11410 [Xenococcus sp. MO_188.B8]|nr:hypothetical protein [Xenococcus sp. MO_188.B8]